MQGSYFTPLHLSAVPPSVVIQSPTGHTLVVRPILRQFYGCVEKPSICPWWQARPCRFSPAQVSKPFKVNFLFWNSIMEKMDGWIVSFLNQIWEAGLHWLRGILEINRSWIFKLIPKQWKDQRQKVFKTHVFVLLPRSTLSVVWFFVFF